MIVDLADSDNSSVEEFEDASETFTEDDIFVDVETKRMQPLSMLRVVKYKQKLGNYCSEKMKFPLHSESTELLMI